MYVRNANTYCITRLPVVITVTEVIFDEACQVSFATYCVLLRHRVEAVEKSLMISFHCVLLIIKVFILPDTHNHNYVMHWFFYSALLRVSAVYVSHYQVGIGSRNE